MLVNFTDGKCSTCESQLEIVSADDATMDVNCTNVECLDAYKVEIDAFNDGGITYWPQVMAASGHETWE